MLRDSLYRGADQVVLISDRKFAGADTLATSYALTRAVQKHGDYDLIFCGRQAIDGDTAQVGPQTAEKLGLPQITYAETVVDLEGDEIVVERALPLGKELVKCTLPCLLTVVGTANQPRPASARKRIEYKLAATPLEYRSLLKKWPEFETEQALDAYLEARAHRRADLHARGRRRARLPHVLQHAHEPRGHRAPHLRRAPGGVDPGIHCRLGY